MTVPQKHINLRGRTQFAPTSREQPKTRSANLPTCWGGGTSKARDGGANYIKIHGRARRPAPTNGAPSRRPLRSNVFLCVGNGLDRSVKLYQITRANTVRPYELGTTLVLFRKITSKPPTPTHEMECVHPYKPPFTPTTNQRRRITSAAIYDSTFGFK